MTITAKRLEDLKACRDQIDQFRQIWKDGPAPMTVEAAVENADAFNWEWIACRVLATPAKVEYERAMLKAGAEYDCAIAPAEAEYVRAIALAKAGAEYDCAIAPAEAEYVRAIAPAKAWTEYKRAKKPADAEYMRAMARAFAEAYIAQEAAA